MHHSLQSLAFAALILVAVTGSASSAKADSINWTPKLKAGKISNYTSQRAPLLASPFAKLDIGTIKPKGWLRTQLELEADGFSGRLGEISGFLKKDGNAWLTPDGSGTNGWEEVPYWLKGFGDLGYVLGDRRIIEEARIWLEGAMRSQRGDGYFGPRSALTSLDGKPDVWAHMPMLNALQSYYEYSQDKRVLEFMTQYFKWQNSLNEKEILNGYWPIHRGGDNIASIYWLYNRTGDEFLLALAGKLHRGGADWVKGMANGHGVNFAQAFREPATFYLQSLDPTHLEATEKRYHDMRDVWGQVPGGLYGADENVRDGMTDPRQAAETCAMVEMMLSCEMLFRDNANPVWADRCEDVAYNSLPASMTADLKALRYLTAPNMVLSDSKNKAPGIQNTGPMFHFDPNNHRCCQHNVAHGWPYFAENLWLAAAGDGLAAAFYAPCEVTAKVAKGKSITIVEETEYPFEDTVRFTVKTSASVRFPLVLRIPGWCNNPELTINGRKEIGDSKAGFAVIDRTWANGDTVRLTLPMSINVTKWTKNKNSVSVNRGPLTYSLKFSEKCVRDGGTDKWPAWDIVPENEWNYGLVFDQKNLSKSFKVVRKGMPKDGQPFRWDASPIEIKATGRKIPGWMADGYGLVGLLRPSPVKTSEPDEALTLIPMGCARLRISSFPTVSDTPDAHEWPVAKKPIPTSVSYCYERDTPAALSDGLEPITSNDQGIPRLTWWEHKGTTEWVQYDFAEEKNLSCSDVYWFNDTATGGGCGLPSSWRLLYFENGQWKPVETTDSYSPSADKYNSVSFKPIKTKSFRLEVRLKEGLSGGILEWKVR